MRQETVVVKSEKHAPFSRCCRVCKFQSPGDSRTMHARVQISVRWITLLLHLAYEYLLLLCRSTNVVHMTRPPLVNLISWAEAKPPCHVQAGLLLSAQLTGEESWSAIFQFISSYTKVLVSVSCFFILLSFPYVFIMLLMFVPSSRCYVCVHIFFIFGPTPTISWS